MASQAEFARLKENPNIADLYLPTAGDAEGSSPDDLPVVGSAFYRQFKKVFWHTASPIRPEASGTRKNDDETMSTTKFMLASSVATDTKSKNRFYPNRYLFSSTGKFYFPSAKVKPDYQEKVQIAWSPDAGIYYCNESRFKIGDITYDNFGSSWIDDFYGWNRGDTPQSTVDESILNLPSMTSWGTELAADVATFLIPHFFSYSAASAFPLFLVDENIKITQEITYPTDVAAHLLRVRVSDGNEWFPAEYSAVKQYIEIGPYSSPSLLCDVFDISPNESEKNREEDTIVIPIQRVISIKRPNTTPSGIADEVTINGTDPVVAMFMKSKNTEAEKYNDHSNCTNMLDESDPKAVSSMSYVKLNYGQVEKFMYRPEEMRSNRMLRFFTSIPKRRGRFAHAFSLRPFDPTKLSGMIPDNDLKAKLECQMTGKSKEQKVEEKPSDVDIIGSIIAKKKLKVQEEVTDENITPYRPEVNLLIHSDLVFIKNEDGLYDISLR